MPKILELFAGAGGLALGLEQAGFESVALIENDKDACATLKINRPSWNIIHDSVENIDYSLYQKLSIDVISGGFPCQAFSFAGKGLGFLDKRGGLIFEMLRAIEAIKPKMVLAENVLGLLSHNQGKTLVTILDCLKELGYDAKYQILNAVNFGVPQKRKRLLITALKNMKHPDETMIGNYKQAIPLKEALANCPSSDSIQYSNYKRSVMDLLPPGGCWIDLPDDIQKKYMGAAYGHNSNQGGRRGMARRMSWDEPSLTILCSPSQKQTERCHPSETRPFTIRESARIQTFPDEWKFCGNIMSQYKQIGNAVPVKLGKEIGLYALNLLNAYERFDYAVAV